MHLVCIELDETVRGAEDHYSHECVDGGAYCFVGEPAYVFIWPIDSIKNCQWKDDSAKKHPRHPDIFSRLWMK